MPADPLILPAPGTDAPPAIPNASARPTGASRARSRLLDGVRGLAIVLVVVSHGWQLWPIEGIDDTPWIRPLFRSGNFAVTIFLVAAGYLTFVTLSARGLPNMRPGVALVRRVLRVGPALWLLLVAVLVVSSLDESDAVAKVDNSESILHVLTYTWNWYVHGNLVTSRPDFGHLWYLSVDMQAFVIMAVLLYALRRRTVGLLFALGGFLLLLTWWRFHVTDTEYPFQVLVRTTTRMDPFVVGVMLGAALQLVRRRWGPEGISTVVFQRNAHRAALAAAVLLLPLMWYCSRDERFLAWGVVALELDLAVLFGAASLVVAPTGVVSALSARPLAFLGRHSLLLYIWHYPVFVFVRRHTHDWDWPVRTLVGLALTVAVSLAAYFLVERRAAQLLRHPRWAELDDGLPKTVERLSRTGWQAIRNRRTPGSTDTTDLTDTGDRESSTPL